jgi:hypothetical protein
MKILARQKAMSLNQSSKLRRLSGTFAKWLYKTKNLVFQARLIQKSKLMLKMKAREKHQPQDFLSQTK